MKIRIIKTPPGFAEEDIRDAWVGIEMEAEKEDGSTGWCRDDNKGGYVVEGTVAVEALLAADRNSAAVFWSSPVPPRKLRFRADCCEEIS